MKVIYSKEYNLNIPIVLTIGMFDGVHVGHQKIIYFINKIAKKKKIPSCLLTFEPHPRFIINKKNNFKLLTPLNEKIKKLKLLKIHTLIIQEFNNIFRELSSDQFVKTILVQKLNIDTLVIGHDHQFGKNREGNFNQLSKLSKKFNFKLIQYPAIKKQQNIISSTKIRNALSIGDLITVKEFLGNSYSISGEVIPGSGIGKKIGFSTANINVNNEKLIPKKGVYFVEVSINSSIYFGMMNIGNRPTFKGKNQQIEVHIFNFSKNIYGQEISIRLKNYIREEIQFTSSEELIKQIKKDENIIKTYFLNKI